MVQFAAQRLMEIEAESLYGAGYDEKIPERINIRNDYRDRARETRAGTIELQVGTYSRDVALFLLPGVHACWHDHSGGCPKISSK